MATNGCSCGCPPAGHRHKPGGGSLWYGDQPQGGRRHGVLFSKGDMISPPSLPRSPGLGTGTRLEGAPLWRHLGPRGWAPPCNVQRDRRGAEKKNRHFAKSCAWTGWWADGAVLWNHFDMWCIASAAHWPFGQSPFFGPPIRLPLDPAGAQSHDLPADLVVNRAGAGTCAVGEAGEPFLRESAPVAPSIATRSRYTAIVRNTKTRDGEPCRRRSMVRPRPYHSRIG